MSENDNVRAVGFHGSAPKEGRPSHDPDNVADVRRALFGNRRINPENLAAVAVRGQERREMRPTGSCDCCRDVKRNVVALLLAGVDNFDEGCENRQCLVFREYEMRDGQCNEETGGCDSHGGFIYYIKLPLVA